MEPQDVVASLDVAKKPNLLSSKNSRIGNGMAFLILIIAGITEVLTLLPFVGDLIAPIFWIAFALYLWKAGCGFLKLQRLAPEIVSFACEMIPGLQELPTIILATILIILTVRLEDRTGRSILKPLASGKGPLNQNGVRRPINTPFNRPLNEDGVRQPTNYQPSSAKVGGSAGGRSANGPNNSGVSRQRQ
jgi:hypothetical protein